VVTPGVPTHLGVRAALSLGLLGDIGVKEAHIPGRAGLSISVNQLVDRGANTVRRRIHSIQRLLSNHAHITCQKLPVNVNRAQRPPLRCQGSSSCTTACSCLKPWVAREQKVEIAVRTRRYWPMAEPHAWTMSCARVASCWAIHVQIVEASKEAAPYSIP
jgi:acyl-CoA hydrolase